MIEVAAFREVERLVVNCGSSYGSSPNERLLSPFSREHKAASPMAPWPGSSWRILLLGAKHLSGLWSDPSGRDVTGPAPCLYNVDTQVPDGLDVVEKLLCTVRGGGQCPRNDANPPLPYWPKCQTCSLSVHLTMCDDGSPNARVVGWQAEIPQAKRLSIYEGQLHVWASANDVIASRRYIHRSADRSAVQETSYSPGPLWRAQ